MNSFTHNSDLLFFLFCLSSSVYFPLTFFSLSLSCLFFPAVLLLPRLLFLHFSFISFLLSSSSTSFFPSSPFSVILFSSTLSLSFPSSHFLLRFLRSHASLPLSISFLLLLTFLFPSFNSHTPLPHSHSHSSRPPAPPSSFIQSTFLLLHISLCLLFFHFIPLLPFLLPLFFPV